MLCTEFIALTVLNHSTPLNPRQRQPLLPFNSSSLPPRNVQGPGHLLLTCQALSLPSDPRPCALLQNLEKQMRQLAVIPPMLYDADQQRIKFINMNGLMDDPMKVYKDRQVTNMWSEQERDTFREK
jgi:hypothetical protein